MLTIRGGRTGTFCDGVSRRSFLKIGGLALGGLALPDILRAEAQAGIRQSHRAVIMVFLPGGPPHQDMYDLKTEAPAEIRGEFKPIRTNVQGIEICEHLPRMAAMADKLVFIRSLIGCRDEHDAEQCLTGFTMRDSRQQGGRPSLGSILSRLHGPVDRSVPPFVGLSPKMGHVPWSKTGDPGYLGLAHAPFKPDGQGMADMTLNGVSLNQLQDRKALLTSFDRLRRDIDNTGTLDGMDSFTQQALNVLTSSKLLQALDLSREPDRIRERYGRGTMQPVDDGGPCYNEHFLMARRLVEAGVRCVTLAFARWDYHGQNFKQCKERLPKLDQALTALVQDLHDRGLDQDVSVVMWGEFGRTPRINKDAGRDHWPQVSSALLACGGLRTGQVIGSTNRLGEVPKDRPVHYQNVFATLYHSLGIDPATTLPDRQGRPMYLLDTREPITEVI
jgi:hypothetical protein